MRKLTKAAEKGKLNMASIMEEARSQPEWDVETITPEIAQRWLDRYNTENRKVRATAVARYVRDIENGDWDFTGDPIKFDTRGVLIDGQHRLVAVVKSGKSIRLLVVRGVNTSARSVVDTGAARSKGDALQLEGYKHATTYASAIKYALCWDRGLITHANSGSDLNLTHSEIVEFADEYEAKGLYDAVIDARTGPSRPETAVTSTVESVARYLQRQVASQEEVDEFWYGVYFTAGPGDARWTLRSWSPHRPARTVRDSSFRMYAVATAWNAWRKGKNMRISPIMTKEVISDEGNVIQPTVWRMIPKMK